MYPLQPRFVFAFMCALLLLVVTSPVSAQAGGIAVSIDIKPGEYPNCINLGSNGLIPVAILTTPTFDATTVDPATVKLAASSVAVAGNGKKLLCSTTDVDGDGDTDLLVHVRTEDLGLPMSATQATLTGTTYGGLPVIGSDSIVIVPKKSGVPLPAAAMAGTTPDINPPFGDDGGILVAWNDPSSVALSDILEFHIWRVYVWGDIIFMGLVMAPDLASAMPYFGPAGSFDHAVVDGVFIREFSYRYPDMDHTELHEGSMVAAGITVGQTHSYWINCLYRRTSPLDGTISYWEANGVSAGRATYLTRPALQSPGSVVPSEYVDLSNVTFVWEGSGGADAYVIEVSTTPSFARDKTWVGHVFHPTNADGTIISKTFVGVLSTSPELADLPGGTVLFWRVGARNSQDVPGPYPAGPSPTLDGEKNTRYIYTRMSDIFTFMTPGDGPPPPPDDGGGDEPPPPPPF